MDGSELLNKNHMNAIQSMEFSSLVFVECGSEWIQCVYLRLGPREFFSVLLIDSLSLLRSLRFQIVQSAEAAEYTDCTSAEA